MSINENKLVEISKLAKLNLSVDNLTKSTAQINDILAFIEQLAEVNTNDISPMAHPLEMSQRLRKDKAVNIINKTDLQTIAPDVEQGFYLVPTVIE